jgi:hypothetical protein
MYSVTLAGNSHVNNRDNVITFVVFLQQRSGLVHRPHGKSTVVQVKQCEGFARRHFSL